MSELVQPPQERIRFNPVDPAFRCDPYPTYARLRQEAPHHRAMGALVLTRHADVVAALKERSLSVDLIRAGAARAAARHGVGDFSLAERFIRNSLVFTDDPQHIRLRRLINQAFSPRTMALLKPIITAECQSLLAGVEYGCDIDAVERFTVPLPINVLCQWLGLPAQTRPLVAQHIHAIRHLLDPGLVSKAGCAEAVLAVTELTALFSQHIRHAAAHAGNGVISALCAARDVDGSCLDQTEVAFACIMFFVAGTETSQCMLGNLLEVLATHAEVFAALKQQPECVGQAVEESIRHETPLQMTKRVAREPISINGYALRAEEQVLLCLGAANRDPQVFDEPDTFRLDRRGVGHVGFGTGMHTCLGAGLARMQATSFTTLLLANCASIQRASAAREWLSHSVILRGPSRLPLRLKDMPRSARLAGLQLASVP